MEHNALALNYQMGKLTEKKRMKISLWDKLLEEFDAATSKGAAVLELQVKYGIRFSKSDLYRKYAAWQKKGKEGLLPARIRNQSSEEATKLPGAFVSFVMQLSAENQRKFAPAWRTLIEEHLCKGKVIPGYDTDWRGIFHLDNPEWAIPEICPYSRKGNRFPKGWTYKNLSRHAVKHYQAIAVRIGTAAAKNFLPTIPTTRVGLPFGRVFIIDDMEHDVKVSFEGNLNAQGVVELGALEATTGHYCAWGLKPVIERLDGTREKLKEDYNRYLVAQIVCGIGFSTDGCLICGEHGTAKLPLDLQETLQELGGGLIQFRAGGIMNKPIGKGLYMGAQRGNFRWKAMLESHWNLAKNELAQLPGQKGADPEHAPEDLESKMKVHRWVAKAALALVKARPDIYEMLESPFPHYFKYIEAYKLLRARIEDRYDHDLEGYEELGFMRPEWRMTTLDIWKPWSELENVKPQQREAIESVINLNQDDCFRNRRMSPAETFQHCRTVYADKLVRLQESCVPRILGVGLANCLQVKDNGTLIVPDRYLPNRSTQVAAIVKNADGMVETLTRGREVLVWLSPVDGRHAYIGSLDGKYIGMAPTMEPGTKVDAEATLRHLKIVSAMQSTELKRLAPVAAARLKEMHRIAENNVKVLTGKTAADLLEHEADAAQVSADADEALLDILTGSKAEQ